jgi:hypothetical protein
MKKATKTMYDKPDLRAQALNLAKVRKELGRRQRPKNFRKDIKKKFFIEEILKTLRPFRQDFWIWKERLPKSISSTWHIQPKSDKKGGARTNSDVTVTLAFDIEDEADPTENYHWYALIIYSPIGYPYSTRYKTINHRSEFASEFVRVIQRYY